MGRQVVQAVKAEPGFEAVAVIEGLTDVLDVDGLDVFGDPTTCISACSPDVIIDFTNADWTPVVAREALKSGVRLVIGTTGLPDEFKDWLRGEAASTKTGAVLAANFALGAVLMMHFARLAAPHFDAAEIIELHHDQKVDSPSGTAAATAELMREARGEDFSHRESDREPIKGARGAEAGGIAIHSVRLPGLVAHQEVLFGGLGQTLTIRHDSTGRDSFMPGVLLAARSVMELDRLVVGLDSLLGLES